MAQWGQGPAQFQRPMQTGFNPQFQQNPQFQPQNPQFQPQNPQFQQQPQQFQQGGLGVPNQGMGILPQQTGFPSQNMGGFPQQQQPQYQLPQRTGMGPGFVQGQPTGMMQQSFQARSAPPPPVPPIPSQFAGNQNLSFLNAPPPQQHPNRFLSASPGLLSQPTGMGMTPLVAQPTGFLDPRLQMMSQTLVNPSAPYTPGIPQYAPPQQNLVQSFQQHGQQSGTPQISWTLTKSEKKQYNNIFRSWESSGTGFITGAMAQEVFGASGLPKDDLAKIWSLADQEDRGKLNNAEFHVAMGLIYRRLTGIPIPDTLPAEMRPPSARDLDESVDIIKDMLHRESRNSPASIDTPQSKLRYHGNGGSGLDSSRDATIYRHTDDTPPEGIYKPRSRHIDRDAVRSRDEENSAAADLKDMKRALASTASRLDRAVEAEASRTKEDEELDQEMEDLKYRVDRVQRDLDYNARGPRTVTKDEERRKLEREMLELMHERIPAVERKMTARDERKEKEKRQWARDRDRTNDRFGRYDRSGDDYSRPYSRGEDRDRTYSRGDDRDRPYSRGADDRDRPYSRGGGYDRDRDRDDRDYRRDRAPQDYDRARSPLAAAPHSPASPSVPPSLTSRQSSTTSAAPPASPAPNMKSMTPEERQAFIRSEAQRRIQERMLKMGVTAPTPSPGVDTSVEERLAQERKEAEERAKQAEKEAEERERARRERLDNEKAAKGGPKSPEVPSAPAPTIVTSAPPPPPALKAAPAPKVAPPPPKPRAAPPAPALKRAAAPPAPAPRQAPAFSARQAPAAPKAPVAPAPADDSSSEDEDEASKQEQLLQARREALKKEREERERKFQEKLKQLEREEEEAAKQEEQGRKAQMEALKLRSKTPTPPEPPKVVATPPVPPPAPSSTVSTPAGEKSHNPFSRLMNKDGSASSPAASPPAAAPPNPWSRPQTAPPPAAAARATSPFPAPARSPGPASAAPASKSYYPTSRNAGEDDDDWGNADDKTDDDDSSDDEIAVSRTARAEMAAQLFGGILPKSPASPAPGASGSAAAAAAAPPPAPPAPAPPAPPAPAFASPPPAPPAPAAPAVGAAPAPPVAPGGMSALLASIQGGARLRRAETVDKSGPALSGKVIGDVAPPPHINTAPPSVEPPSPPLTPVHSHALETPATAHDDPDSKSANRQSVGWFATKAADGLSVPGAMSALPSTAEVDEELESDRFATPLSLPKSDSGSGVPEIKVDEPAGSGQSDLMADIDKSVKKRVRSLYAFEGDGPEDLSFNENLIIVANPSKSGGDWWYGTIVSTGKAGLFPKTYIEEVNTTKARAVYDYTTSSHDELSFSEGQVLQIIDSSEPEWWKAEVDGTVYIVPAGYLEVVEESSSPSKVRDVPAKITIQTDNIDYAMTTPKPAPARFNPHLNPDIILSQTVEDRPHPENGDDSSDEDSSSDADTSSDYLSFDDTDDENDKQNAVKDREARERERQLVLEAAGLIVNQDVPPPPSLARSRSAAKRRPAPAAPSSSHSHTTSTNTSSGRRHASQDKDLPEVPNEPELEPESNTIQSPTIDHATALDDAFARYESFKNHQMNLNRLSVVSTDSALTMPSSPASASGGSRPSSMVMTQSTLSSSTAGSTNGGGNRDRDSGHEANNRSSRHLLHFLGRSKTPEPGERRAGAITTANISAPIMSNTSSGSQLKVGSPGLGGGGGSSQDEQSRANSPSFGMSWASLVDKSALEGIIPGERKRQEAIFELINTEVAYVRDVQLIVEVFYSSMLPLLSTKEVTVIFANVEDLLLTNTGFLSSLEERQKECRLYVDKIGDILLTHIPNMGAYMEYCVNQTTASNVLQSLRDSNPDLASHLQHLRNENPRVRNLDLSSYLLAPMQRITKYPLLIKQILQYTEVGEEYNAIEASRDMAEKLLGHINETIREQEGQETLRKVSQHLWIGQGRLDLTAPTRNMGPRRLLKDGVLVKTKSGRRLHALLCSDILVLTDEGMKNLYRMPIPLAHAQVKHSGTRDETTFQISQAYPRGGDTVSLRAMNSRECQHWVQEIGYATRRARHAEERAAKRNSSRR